MVESPASREKLRILHVLRAPLGGLFRHVLDLTREQIVRGHDVGLVTDSTTGGKRADDVLGELAPSLALGSTRIPMRRQADPLDLIDAVRIASVIHARKPDVVHGHGSKGGLFARLPGLLPIGCQPVRAYTPHGGSFNYVAPHPWMERAYMAAEYILQFPTDIFLFESNFIANRFHDKVGETKALVRIVLNGISPAEFVPVEPAADAADLLYVGELRSAKGIDTLIDAMAELKCRRGLTLRLVLVGSGPDEQKLTARAATRDLQGCITFPGPMPARQAFRMGRVLVVPSRAESLPYIVLEAAGAQLPMVATNVGGIGEIFGPHRHRLIESDNAVMLADTIAAMLAMDAAARRQQAADLAAFVASQFSIANMADSVIEGYRSAFARRAGLLPDPAPSLAPLS